MSPAGAVIYVVDDDPLVRSALERLLGSVGYPIRAFGSAKDFLDAERPPLAGCLVLDVRLPGSSGLELQRRLAQQQATLPIIFISGHGDIPMSVRAMKAGAIEFLPKPFREQELLDAVQRAIEQSREGIRRLAELNRLRARYDSLTPRERQVFPLVATGLIDEQIAGLLHTSEKTVNLHRGQVMQKMGADSVADLVRMAERLGLGAPRVPDD